MNPITITKVQEKTFPKGILKTSKVRGVSNPAKNSPVKKTAKRSLIYLNSDKSFRKHRKTIKNKISKMSDSKVKHIVQTAGLLKNPETPVEIQKEMLEGAIISGFVSI